ncbi:hypothetical protein BDP27DRAFT_1154386, partial [Rhodocollybia butyracea]
QIISVPCDNVSANTAMFEELARILPTLGGLKAHVCCFAHTINLTAKGVLRPFKSKKPKNNTSQSEADIE